MFTTPVFIAVLRRLSKVFDENKDYLSKLDSVIGDGDHGVSMLRGFRAVADKLPQYEGKDLSSIFSMAGTTIVGSIGGATGPIFGTIFLRSGMQTKDKDSIGTQDFARMFRAALEGIQALGKAQVGDKTMVDSLAPTVEALDRAAADGKPLKEALRLAAEAAEAGARSTVELKATKGRARYLGDKAIGHQDAGATSFSLIMKTFYEEVYEDEAQP